MIYYLNIILYLFLSPLPSIFGKSTMDKFQTTITNHIQSSSVLNPHICPACGKHFSTESGANKHLLQSRKCAWYNRSSIKILLSIQILKIMVKTCHMMTISLNLLFLMIYYLMLSTRIMKMR